MGIVFATADTVHPNLDISCCITSRQDTDGSVEGVAWLVTSVWLPLALRLSSFRRQVLSRGVYQIGEV